MRCKTRGLSTSLVTLCLCGSITALYPAAGQELRAKAHEATSERLKAFDQHTEEGISKELRSTVEPERQDADYPCDPFHTERCEKARPTVEETQPPRKDLCRGVKRCKKTLKKAHDALQSPSD
jgi:hypothetical protein